MMMICMQISYCKEVRHATTSQTGCAWNPASLIMHHVIIRGIEHKEIVKDDHDRQNFVYRMGMIALETGTLIYAWALMTNMHIFL
jgi:hypothetical protein